MPDFQALTAEVTSIIACKNLFIVLYKVKLDLYFDGFSFMNFFHLGFFIKTIHCIYTGVKFYFLNIFHISVLFCILIYIFNL